MKKQLGIIIILCINFIIKFLFMRTILFIFFSILFLKTIAQEQKLERFYGMRFGSSTDSIKNVMLQKGYKLNSELSNNDNLIFSNCSNCKFAGKNAPNMLFRFVNDKFYYGTVVLFPEDLTMNPISFYKEVRDEINEKYFTTNETYEKYEYPYKSGDGNEIMAIKEGKAEIRTFWNFSNENLISLSITKEVYVVLEYLDDKLSLEASEQWKKSKLNDY